MWQVCDALGNSSSYKLWTARERLHTLEQKATNLASAPAGCCGRDVFPEVHSVGKGLYF